MCAISCAGMQLKAEDAKIELVLETWVRLKLLFGSIVRFCARLTRLNLFFAGSKNSDVVCMWWDVGSEFIYIYMS